MATIPKLPDEDTKIPDQPDIDYLRRQEIDINRRQESINESDGTYMQAPDPWPEPPEDGDGDT